MSARFGVGALLLGGMALTAGAINFIMRGIAGGAIVHFAVFLRCPLSGPVYRMKKSGFFAFS